MSEDPSRPPLPAYDPDSVPDTQDDRSPAPTGANDGANRPPVELSEAERERALESIEERRGFYWHALSYLLVMLLLNVIWLVTTGFGSFYWPIFPMMGWGIGVGLHAAGLFLDREPTEEEIRLETERLRRKRIARGGKD
ncbi:2TM domain-containing protein [Ornithinimicrobium sp. Y1847]|uniref:2TM domain-containing protein n=1 Tax=unclassified Ornithinimicrobium TaxID=2615080 RepID=UPI003B6778BB